MVMGLSVLSPVTRTAMLPVESSNKLVMHQCLPQHSTLATQAATKTHKLMQTT